MVLARVRVCVLANHRTHHRIAHATPSRTRSRRGPPHVASHRWRACGFRAERWHAVHLQAVLQTGCAVAFSGSRRTTTHSNLCSSMRVCVCVDECERAFRDSLLLNCLRGILWLPEKSRNLNDIRVHRTCIVYQHGRINTFIPFPGDGITK